jgi:hypothetical protein
MNERIKELYDQAHKFASQHRVQSIGAPGNNYFELFHEKFAELIVKECIEQVVTGPNGPAHYAVEAAIRLKKHFGVEE